MSSPGELEKIKKKPTQAKVIVTSVILVFSMIIAWQLLTVGGRWLDQLGLRAFPEFAVGKTNYVNTLSGNTIIVLLLILIVLYLAAHYKEKLTSLI